MSTHKLFERICVAVMICAVILTLLFMNGRSLGLTAIVDEDAESYTGSEYFTANDRDSSWEIGGATVITLDGDTAKISGNGAYVLDGSVYITGAGYYVLRGTLTDGSVVVDAYDSSKVWLLFDGVTITCSDDAGLRVDQAEKVFLTLNDGTENSITSGAVYSDEALEDGTDGAIYARDDMTINGSGSLTVTAEYRHGIEANDDLVITGGTVTVTAQGDAINANDSCRIMRADLTLNAGDDGIVVSGEDGWFYIESGTVAITSGDDGIHTAGDVTIAGGEITIEAGDDAVHSDASIAVTDGTLTIPACYEGLEARVIDVSGGDISIWPTDDGFNASGAGTAMFGEWVSADSGSEGTDSGASGESRITISGGSITIINETGRDADGLDSNGSIFITGGDIRISLTGGGSNNAIDYNTESGAVCEISGGTVIACGGSGMAEGFSSSSEQASILYNLTESVADGSAVVLKDSSGNELLSWEVPLSFNSITVSCPEMAVGETYSLEIAGTAAEVTLEQTAATAGSAVQGMGGMGGFGGMAPGAGDVSGEAGGSESDDGAAGFARGGGQHGRGERPQMGERPEMPSDGERPEMPADGEMPEKPGGGEMPTDGEMPEMPTDGELPDMPADGEMPEMGKAPSDGGMPSTGDVSDAAEAAEDTGTVTTAKSVTEFGLVTWIWLIVSAAAILLGTVIAVTYKRK